MSAEIIKLGVIRRFNPAPVPLIEQPITVRRRYAIEMRLTPENWKRLEQMAWDRRCTVDRLIASMVSEQLDGEGEV